MDSLRGIGGLQEGSASAVYIYKRSGPSTTKHATRSPTHSPSSHLPLEHTPLHGGFETFARSVAHVGDEQAVSSALAAGLALEWTTSGQSKWVFQG